MEVFAKAGGLQKGWLQVGTQVDPYGIEGSYEVQAVLRQTGVSHLWKEGMYRYKVLHYWLLE
eukprot:snap_masked-scaffold_11-processed-gene-9.19-mRNA-1 protein AED:1.00 eAED:1.00 QI:0/-1/0/0/-1/1/1/0/61